MNEVLDRVPPFIRRVPYAARTYPPMLTYKYNSNYVI